MTDDFSRRHIGVHGAERDAMLAAVGAESLTDLIDQIVPADIRLNGGLNLSEGLSETAATSALREYAGRIEVRRDFIGMGYHPTHTPAVIERNVLQNPGWYTAYTPYQPEIAQGRLEALLNYQQMIIDLTGMPLANASLLDEATAAAEAMTLMKRVNRASTSDTIVVADDVHPQTLDVVRTRARPLGIRVEVRPVAEITAGPMGGPFGVLVQYPATTGSIPDLAAVVAASHGTGALVAVAADPMALVALRSPGEAGADVVVGSTQRFGVPVAFGGPHAAYIATREEYRRSLPGRLIGVSRDRAGRPALRMALQTREQHIRREKATSNICTAQVLLANIAAFYAVYHGPDGLRDIARRIHRRTAQVAEHLRDGGIDLLGDSFFDTLTIPAGALAESDRKAIELRADAFRINLRHDADGAIGLSLNETTTESDVADLIEVLTGARPGQLPDDPPSGIPETARRTGALLTHPVFHSHRSETEMMRYLRRLEGKDLALNHSMIPLGSCTMKLNAAAQMAPISWPEFSQPHPFAPAEQVQGYRDLVDDLAALLAEITGFDAISMQPNSGAQGEYAGLLAIRRYQEGEGQSHRDICLIPQSAHGTNPASAQMMGLRVVVVATDEAGNIDLADLSAKVDAAGDRLSCLMITYPSTHGVYEASVREVCDLVHRAGGQVYMDGANLNAQVGLTRPGDIGADVSHLNLHKTFAIPHGGGGPGMGPIGVRAHLAPYLPGHIIDGVVEPASAVSAAPFGSAGILPISWMYIRLLGAAGLTESSKIALLNANYVASRLADHFPILYTGTAGRVAHECIIDVRPLKARSGITEVDIAKRLMDYGFHAPTMSFPVPGTFMIEPTESESKAELDRFVDAMISIRAEVDHVIDGAWPADDNPLVRAPHAAADLVGEWDRPYSRAVAVYPLPWLVENKFWPSVNRIDDAYGDRNLFCSCPLPGDLAEEI